ncbi:MAG TPA: hypothetical protein VFB28_12095 [Terriglobales bacterium]|nr:hypothetical protein [Terriglobales bacterium]
MHLKVIETGETRTIPMPERLKEPKMELSLADFAWSRDGTEFLANARPAGVPMEDSSEEQDIERGGWSIWEFSLPDGNARMLRRQAWADSYSPDGSLIAFRANKGRYGTREIWLTETAGPKRTFTVRFTSRKPAWFTVSLYLPGAKKKN